MTIVEFADLGEVGEHTCLENTLHKRPPAMMQLRRLPNDFYDSTTT